MARQTKATRLTKETIAQIRSTHARRATNLLSRLGRFAEGDEAIEMSAQQVKAAQVVISNVLPAMQSTQIEDITENTVDKAAIESAYQEAMQALRMQLTPADITQVLGTMDAETRQALIDSIDARKQ